MASTGARTLGDAIAVKRILVCVGSGGVGKTTTAAALALDGARRGLRTLVLTIDPAKRLANSLGLAELGHTVQKIDPALVAAGQRPGAKTGELYAMMLDQKRAFDEVVAKHAKDPAAMKRILANPVYAQISGSLAGAQEYAAMAKLHDFDATGEWELIVVDTPPTAHALDFLDAPRKLTEAIDSPAIDWFRKMQGGGKSGWSVLGRTSSMILTRLSKFVGSQFLDDLSVFFNEFNDILGGFRVRAEETASLLKQPRVGFILVASPEPMATREALFFHARLQQAAMPVLGFVVNKVHESKPVEVNAAGVVALLSAAPAVSALDLTQTSLRIAADAMLSAHAELQEKAAADRKAIGELRRVGGADTVIACVPFLSEDIHDVARLIELSRRITTS